MSKSLRTNIANITRNKRLRATIVEVMNDKVSVNILGSGKIIRSLNYVGQRPVAGQSVFIDYTTGKPFVDCSNIESAGYSLPSSLANIHPSNLESQVDPSPISDGWIPAPIIPSIYGDPVAFGIDVSVIKSSDGATWVSIGPSNVYVNDSIFVDGVFYAATVCYQHAQGTHFAAHSTDCVTWTEMGSGMMGGNAIIKFGSIYVVAGARKLDAGYLTPYEWSDDNCATWKHKNSTIGYVMQEGTCLCANDTICVMGGIRDGTSADHCLAYTYNGYDWTAISTNIFDAVSGIAWNGTYFVAVGGGNNTLAYSSDGINWTGLGKTIFGSLANTITYGNGLFVAGGYNSSTGNIMAHSSDGINWTGDGIGPFTNIGGNNGYATTVKYKGMLFVACGTNNDSSKTLAYSADGINWSSATSPVSEFTFRSVILL